MRYPVGYGVCIRNTPIDKEKTVAYQELNAIGFDGDDAVIDIVRSDTANRPKLQNLIDTLNEGDRIDMYSVDSLLMGDSRKAIEYYTAIITKGIDLLVFDFSGAIARISPISTLRFGKAREGEPAFVKNETSISELIELFKIYYNNEEPEKNSGGLKIQARMEFNDAFKDIYFAYESYIIDMDTTLSLLSEYCGIENKITFWLMAKDFETDLWYSEELAMQSYEILELPKRCGGLPKEYGEIIAYASEHYSHLNTEEEQIKYSMESLNMVGSYQIFLRWKLLAEKKPKPRILKNNKEHQARIKNFVEEFKAKHQPLDKSK